MMPVTVDGRIDLDALPRLLTLRDQADLAGACLQRHRRAARCARVVSLAKTVGAKVMLDGAQRAPHGPLDLARPRHRFLRLRRPQGLRPQRHRRAVGQARAARGDAAVPWRRLDDRPRHPGRDDLGAAAAPLRGRHAADRPGDRPGRRLQLDGAGSTGRRRTPTRWRWCERLLDGLQKIDGTQILGPASLQNRYPVRVLHARRRASARRGADPRFVRRRGARRPSLLPAADGPLRPRRHDARLDRALQRQHRHRRAADRRRARGRAPCDERQLYQDRIVALAKAKTGAGKLAAPTKSARRDNPLCGDRVTIDVKLDDSGQIAEIAHQVRGCLLCQASASALAVGRRRPRRRRHRRAAPRRRTRDRPRRGRGARAVRRLRAGRQRTSRATNACCCRSRR